MALIFLFYGDCLKALCSSIMRREPVLHKQAYESFCKEQHTHYYNWKFFLLLLTFHEFSWNYFKVGIGTNLIWMWDELESFIVLFLTLIM